jgi:serine/threonine protein kinase
MSDLIGQQLGNYRLTRLLGSGGFAEVYLGEHVRLNMLAAIKVLHAHLSEEEKASFQHEAQVIAELVHPNIVRVLDFDVKEHMPFLVLDYAPNGSLRQHYPKGTRIPLVQVVTYVKQIADALQYAHNHKLIHRDVKPENMLLGRQNEVLLSDFGIVAIAHSTSSMSTQASMGTIPYMAPEQIQAHPRPASDQYALGIVVYQWLSGELPFQGSASEIIAKHLSMPPVSLLTKASDLSPKVEQVLFTALAKDFKDRFGSIQDFANALEQASRHSSSQVLPLVRSQDDMLRPRAASPELSVTAPAIHDTVSAGGKMLYPTYPAMQPELSAPGQPPGERQRIAFIQGLIFGIILFASCAILVTVAKLLPYTISNTLEPYTSSTFIAISILCYFFSSMRAARRTMSVRIGLITSLWATLSLFSAFAVISSIVNNYNGIFHNILFAAIISLMGGVVGLGISAFGGMLGRNGARKAYMRKAIQATLAGKQ